MSESKDTISVACNCGKRYRLPPDKAGLTFRCKGCGDRVRVPEVAPSRDTCPEPKPKPDLAAGPKEAASPVMDMHFDGDREVADPDTLMDEVKQSRMIRTILVSLVAHLLFLGLTSFGLYTDWAEYGLMMPSEIKAEKAARVEAERKRKATEEADKKAAAIAEAAAKTEDASQGKTGVEASVNDDKPDAGKEKSDYEKKVLEVSHERPTQSSVKGLDGDLGLD